MNKQIDNTIDFIIDDIELDYILQGAFEGGSTYWAVKVVVEDDDYKGADYASDAVSKGAILEIWIDEPIDDSDKIIYKLGKQELLNGIEQYANEYHHLDFNQMDAGEYDIILQFALFKERIFC